MGTAHLSPELIRQARKLGAVYVQIGSTASIDSSHGDKSMRELGLQEGSELMVLKREPWKIKEPGQSKYNEDYVCSVLEVREVGPNSIELDFSVRGDGSLGNLQKSEASRLLWASEGAKQDEPEGRLGRLDVELFLFQFREAHGHLNKSSRASQVQHRVNDNKLKEGTMTFTDVPTSGTLSFVFGEGGYSALEMEVGPEVMSSE